MEVFDVVSCDTKNGLRRVGLRDARGCRAARTFHRYALVGKGDTVYIDPSFPTNAYVISSEDRNDLIRISPHYERNSELRIGSSAYPLRITEICSNDDAESYRYLEAFHYKSSIAIGDQETTPATDNHGVGGRKGVLICYQRIGNRWYPIGYIELQMPLLMVKPRHELFNHSFKHPTRAVEWSQWNQLSMRAYVNCIVRIARLVVSPEYRGLGVSKLLIATAKEFARERWHVSGRRPLFIEISAEMLKYIDFASSAGLTYVGDTEGNVARVSKDLAYMQNNYEVSSGIMSLQKKYLTRLRQGAEALGRSFESMLELLVDVTRNQDKISFLSAAEYYYVKSVLRFPIPYFLAGLDDHSARYIREALAELSYRLPTKSHHVGAVRPFAVKPGRIDITSLTITTEYELPRTKYVQAIRDCFGIDGTHLTNDVIANLHVEASGGNIVLVSGPSGTGKSLLLRGLDPDMASPHVRVSRELRSGQDCSVGWIRDLPSDVPIIEYFASRWGVDRALSALNQSGLAEAYVYLRPYALLSRGQRYRARLADLALREDQVWLIDEFCADLDPITAKVVATNLRKHVIKYQRIAFVAAANHDHYIDALRPTRIIRLRYGFSPEIFTYKEYVDEFQQHSSSQV